jgi:hypothetical protein
MPPRRARALEDVLVREMGLEIGEHGSALRRAYARSSAASTRMTGVWPAIDGSSSAPDWVWPACSAPRRRWTDDALSNRLAQKGE